MLTRHHSYMICSASRRSFLSGRLPVHGGTGQSVVCSNELPLQFTTLSEKLNAAGYESHFIGKGHLGHFTTDHLPVNRGFASRTGCLEGAESYVHGDPAGSEVLRDMWQDEQPMAVAAANSIFCSTSFYSDLAVSKITQPRNASTPFWVHLAHQAAHAPYMPLPAWELLPASASFRS